MMALRDPYTRSFSIPLMSLSLDWQSETGDTYGMLGVMSGESTKEEDFRSAIPDNVSVSDLVIPGSHFPHCKATLGGTQNQTHSFASSGKWASERASVESKSVGRGPSRKQHSTRLTLLYR